MNTIINKLLLIQFITLLLISITVNFAYTGEHNTEWIIVPGKQVGPITPKTSEADLIRIYGKGNVISKTIYDGEELYPGGTIIYPENDHKAVQILWKDIDKRKNPKRLSIIGLKSLWKTVEGITNGTSMKELERINGKPFLIHGVGVDSSGFVTSWEKGRLEKLFSINKEIDIILCEQKQENVTLEELDSVTGSNQFKSNNKVLNKMDFKVCRIIVYFN